MLKNARTPLLAAGLVGLAMVAATIAVAQDNSGSAAQSTGQSSASSQPASTNANGAQAGSTAGAASAQPSANLPNDTNLQQHQSSTTQQQANAPVSDPEIGAQTAAGVRASGGQAPVGQTNRAQNADARNANMPNSPAPGRYEARLPADDNTRSGRGGASLGINVISDEEGQGLVVARVRPGTPAEQMGLQPRDRIISLNGQPVGAVDEFISGIRGMNPGDQVQLSIDRGGNTRNINGRVEALRDTLAASEGTTGDTMGRSRDIRAGSDNMQTSYEERGQGGRQSSGDVEARLSRLEQQIDRLSRQIEQMRGSTTGSQSSPGQAGDVNTPQPPLATPATGAGAPNR